MNAVPEGNVVRPPRRPGGCQTRRVFLGAVVPLLAGGMFAQPAPQFVRFSVFSPRPIAHVAFGPKENAEPQTLKFYPTARSPRYEYRGMMPLRFIDAEKGDVVAEAAIPASITDALLLFLPPAKGDHDGGPRYRVAVLDDSAARQGPGGLAIVNLSGLALAGTVNGAGVTLQSGLNPTVNVNRSARVVLRTQLKGRSYQSYADTITLGAGQRALLLLFPPFYQGSLEVQARVLLDAPGVARR